MLLSGMKHFVLLEQSFLFQEPSTTFNEFYIVSTYFLLLLLSFNAFFPLPCKQKGSKTI